MVQGAFYQKTAASTDLVVGKPGIREKRCFSLKPLPQKAGSLPSITLKYLHICVTYMQ